MTSRRGILWDFDGTLAYRTGLWRDLLVETLDLEAAGHGFDASAFREGLSRGFPWHDWEQIRDSRPSPDEWWASITDLLLRTLVDAGVEPDLAARVAARARSEYLRPDRWQLYADTLAALDRLTAAGWRHAILSNHVPELRALVESLGFADRFDAVLTSAVTGFEKPHPGAFALGRAALSEPDVLWMVGDNPWADVEGARRAGIPALLVRRELAPDGDRADLTELLELIDGHDTLPLRRAARVLLVDEAERVLLVRVEDPVSGSSFWATPGGGLETDETFERAARREVAEETGVTDLELGPVVWVREDRGRFMGRPFHVLEHIFLACVSTFEPVAVGYTELERQVQTAARWWTLDELRRSNEDFAPRKFVAEFERVLSSGPPRHPVDVGS